MPRSTRSLIRTHARILRMEGEVVTCLIAANTGTTQSRTSAFDAVEEQSPSDPSLDTAVDIYARVTYQPFATITRDEGGRVRQSTIMVEGDASDIDTLHRCYAVRLDDGSVLIKELERWSEGREAYTIQCSSYMNTEM